MARRRASLEHLLCRTVDAAPPRHVKENGCVGNDDIHLRTRSWNRHQIEPSPSLRLQRQRGSERRLQVIFDEHETQAGETDSPDPKVYSSQIHHHAA